MLLQAEISLYPLGEGSLAASIFAFIEKLERPGLAIETGPMSTVIAGEDAVVHAALREAYAEVARGRRAVMVVKIYNGPVQREG